MLRFFFVRDDLAVTLSLAASGVFSSFRLADVRCCWLDWLALLESRHSMSLISLSVVSMVGRRDDGLTDGLAAGLADGCFLDAGVDVDFGDDDIFLLPSMAAARHRLK